MNRPKKIILIIVDTLRADHLGCYGYEKDTSPNIDSICKDGILFKHCFSPSSHTIPSHGSIFTSKYPSNHSIGFNQNILLEIGKLDTDIDITLAEILNNTNYKTAGYVSGIVLNKSTNLNSGFEVYDDDIGSDPFGRRDCSSTTQRAINWIKENMDNDFFIFIHYFNVHGPYLAPELYKNIFLDELSFKKSTKIEATTNSHYPLLNKIPLYQILNAKYDECGNIVAFEDNPDYYISQYDACIKYVDDAIGQIISELKELRIYEDALVIITSDHGESFGENGVFFYHGLTVTPDQILVPLIIKPAGDGNIENKTIDTPVSTLDIMPTILSISDYDYSTMKLEGYSLKKLIDTGSDVILSSRTLMSENERQYTLIKPNGLMTLYKKLIPDSEYYPNIPNLIDSLNEVVLCWNSSDECLLALPFDQYQRYKLASNIVNKLRGNKGTFKILEVGAGAEGNLKKFLPLDEIYYLDKELPMQFELKPDYVIGDLLERDITEIYDIVISIDTYEHIHATKRQLFLDKLINHSKKATILAAPFDTFYVAESEIILNETYKICHGLGYKWLEEHIQNGLPSLESTVDIIIERGFNCVIIPNGYLPRWFEMISLYLLTEGLAEFSKMMINLNKFYNKNFYNIDNVEPAYRYFLLITTDQDIPDLSDLYSRPNDLDDTKLKHQLLSSFTTKVEKLHNAFITGRIAELNSRLHERDGQIAELNGQIAELNSRLQESESRVQTLSSDIAEMQRSIVWQLAMKYHNGFVERIMPQGTGRRKKYNLGLKGCRILANEGWRSFLRRYREYRLVRKYDNNINKTDEEILLMTKMDNTKSKPTTEKNSDTDQSKYISELSMQNKLISFLSQPNNSLKFYKSSEPVVSIIILTYNKAEYSFQCLESILAHTDVPHEVIIIDNGSTDESINFLNKVKNISIIKNEVNVGFVSGCNQGANISKGKYLLFLNNDVVVTPNWLSMMVNTIEASPKNGAVGCKLVWPNGLLQEAGCIVWNDGSTLGYGRGDNPYLPQYSYLREVDYCSGACLLVRADIFKTLGGFDERYIPAYYEDADLCLAIKDEGYNVIYQPNVMVFHNEFTSSSIEKARNLMKSNKIKFEEKWRILLEDKYPPNFDFVLSARDISKNPKILFLDDRIPVPHHGMGFPRSYEMLNIIAELGFRITFYPLDKSIPFQPVTNDLQQAGIEVIYGDNLNFIQFARERCNLYDIILVSRPHNMEKAYPIIKEYFPMAKLIYDAEAMFSIREIRKANLRGEKLDKRQIEIMISKEIILMEKADLIITVSEGEKKTILEIAKLKNVEVWGHSIIARKTERDFQERNDILFIGSFLAPDSPNEDAVLFFAKEILPKIRNEVPCRLFVVGINPPESIKKLASPSIIVTGYVEDLKQYYDKCRIFVVPHRFSAGIPLKLEEAMSYGIPAVVSELTASQLNLVDEEEVLVAMNSEEFAEKVIRLYKNEELWNLIRSNSLKYIQEMCNPELMKQNLEKIFSANFTK